MARQAGWCFPPLPLHLTGLLLEGQFLETTPQGYSVAFCKAESGCHPALLSMLAVSTRAKSGTLLSYVFRFLDTSGLCPCGLEGLGLEPKSFSPFFETQNWVPPFLWCFTFALEGSSLF